MARGPIYANLESSEGDIFAEGALEDARTYAASFKDSPDTRQEQADHISNDRTSRWRKWSLIALLSVLVASLGLLRFLRS